MPYKGNLELGSGRLPQKYTSPASVWFLSNESFVKTTFQPEKMTYIPFGLRVTFLISFLAVILISWNSFLGKYMKPIHLRFRELHDKLFWNCFLGKSHVSCTKQHLEYF